MIIREALISDVPAMARVRINTWRAAYAGIVPDEVLANLSYESNEARWRQSLFEEHPAGNFALVSETDKGEVVGIAMGGSERTGDGKFTGQIYVLYILPAYQRQGVGQALVLELARRLLVNGHNSLLIWVLADNHPGRAFYEAIGGTLAREQVIKIGGRELSEVGYGYDTRALIARLDNNSSAVDAPQRKSHDE